MNGTEDWKKTKGRSLRAKAESITIYYTHTQTGKHDTHTHLATRTIKYSSGHIDIKCIKI